MTLVWLAAGEASGDVLGARLMAALRALRPDVTFAGIGGQRMQAAGLEPLFPMNELALMGLVEVVPHLRRLAGRLDQAAADIARRRPACVVTIDAPGFMLRLLKRVAPLGVKRAHYVAPQAWAWRESRVRGYPGLWDSLLCLLPFEPAFFARHGLGGVFVGHPVLESGVDQGDGPGFRAAHGIGRQERLVLAMPGSRDGEIKRHLPVFIQTLEALQRAVPHRLVVPAAPGQAGPLRAAGWPQPPIVIEAEAERIDAYAAADAALAKSGTTTLELAIAGVPMTVGYRMNPISGWLAQFVVKVPYVSLVNLLHGRAVVPERLTSHFTASRLTPDLLALLTDPAAAAAQRAAFTGLAAMLRPPDGTPSQAAAAEVLRLIEQA